MHKNFEISTKLNVWKYQSHDVVVVVLQHIYRLHHDVTQNPLFKLFLYFSTAIILAIIKVMIT